MTDNTIMGIAHIKEGTIQTIEEHSINVSELCSSYANGIGTPSMGKIIGLIHDMGKCSEEFSSYILSASGLIQKCDSNYVDPISKKGMIDHSTAGAQYLMNNQALSNNEYLRIILAETVMSHHSGLVDITTPGKDISPFDERISKPSEKTHLSESIEKLPDIIKNEIDTIIKSGVLEKEFCSILETAKRHNLDRIQTMFSLSLVTRYLLSCLVDADRTDTSNFMTSQPFCNNFVPWSIVSNTLDLHLNRFPKNEPLSDIRNKLSQKCHDMGPEEMGIFTLPAPTGTGKTLASLRFAIEHAKKHGLNRIVYVIPYTSIIDQNVESIRSALTDDQGNSPTILEHHSSIVVDDTDEYEYRKMTDNWDVQIILTTTVQYLNSFYSSGNSYVRRMHNLSNSVLIFDEIQSIPPKCLGLFNESINFLVTFCNSSAVLCTATPNTSSHSKNKHNIIKEKALIEVDMFSEMKERTHLENMTRNRGWNIEETSNLVLNQSKNLSTLVIVNTKKEAESLARCISNKTTRKIFYLSTNLCPRHRKNILNEMEQDLNDKKDVICISTQLIEAGVDLDFDTVFRSISGWPSILQAAGRCNRNCKKETGRVIIYNSSSENISFMDELRIAHDQTVRILQDNDCNGDKYNMLVQYNEYFENANSSTVYDYDIKKMGTTLFSLLTYPSKHSKHQMHQSFDTAGKLFRAIEDDSIGIIVPIHGGESLIDEIRYNDKPVLPRSLTREIQTCSVNVRRKKFEKMLSEGTITEIKLGCGIYSYSGLYDKTYGISEEESNGE